MSAKISNKELNDYAIKQTGKPLCEVMPKDVGSASVEYWKANPKLSRLNGALYKAAVKNKQAQCKQSAAEPKPEHEATMTFQVFNAGKGHQCFVYFTKGGDTIGIPITRKSADRLIALGAPYEG